MKLAIQIRTAQAWIEAHTEVRVKEALEAIKKQAADAQQSIGTNEKEQAMNQLIDQIKGMTDDLKALNDRHESETLNAVAKYVEKANAFQLWCLLNAMVDPVSDLLGCAHGIEDARDELAEFIKVEEIGD